MWKDFLKVICIFNLLLFDLIAEVDLEHKYRSLNDLSGYLTSREYTEGFREGYDLIEYLSKLSDLPAGLSTSYTKFDSQFNNWINELTSLEEQITASSYMQAGIIEFYGVPTQVSRDRTLVEDSDGGKIAIKGKLNLNKWQTFKLLNISSWIVYTEYDSYTGEEISSQNLDLYELYRGQYDKEYLGLTKRKGQIEINLQKEVNRFAESLIPQIEAEKKRVRDQLVTAFQSAFENDLAEKNFERAYKTLAKYEPYLLEMSSNASPTNNLSTQGQRIDSSTIQKLSLRVYNEHYQDISDLIDMYVLKSAEEQITKFKELNKNRDDMKQRAGELQTKLKNR